MFKRPRDGRRGQGQDVDRGLELLDLLLVADAEALLLVDDEQAEVLEADVLGEEPVRADEDVDEALAAVLDDGLLLRAAPGAGSGPRRGRERGPCAPRKVLRCWLARTVVGQRTATCLPSMTALKAARMATSVLP